MARGYTGGVTVFEVSNDTLKEFYLCASPASLTELIREQCDRQPAAIAHWKKGQAIFYTEIESFPDLKNAEGFMAKYAVVIARTGWKVLR
jgi:hypothetical protein